MFILEDSRAAVVITHKETIGNLPDYTGHSVCIDSDWAAISRESAARPASPVLAENSAYVIYTSGSTGTPKGVVVTHSNVARLFEATRHWFHFDENDTWTLFHSYAFDFSVWELWGALLYGGRLILVPYWVSRTPEAFYGLLYQERVTVLNQTPSAFYQLIDVEESGETVRKLDLRLVIFGGEALELQRLRPWFDRHGSRSPQLVNMYGITETTVHVTYRPLTPADCSRPSASPVGVPIPDLRAYLLDPHENLVPISVSGEIHVGGPGLARGYLARPGLTAERFIPDPFGGGPGSRLYRSGDLARYLSGSDLEYLGRKDHQVKIRGFRIELGEIEALLRQHPYVRETVVLSQEDNQGDKRLVAYVVAGSEPAPSATELRNYLSERLPEYMVPSAFVSLDGLPLTPNGKLDRRALPEPDRTRADSEESFVAPVTSVERTLADIWAEVLGVKQVGVHDNFFELGGDSILSIRIVARAKQKGLRLAAKHLFQFQTIAALAKATEVAESIWSQQGPVVGAVPLTPIQHFFFEQEMVDPHHYNQAVLLEARQPFSAELLEKALGHLIEHHDALRLRFVRTASGWEQTCASPGGDVPFVRMDLSGLAESDRSVAIEAASAAAQASLDLAEGPLMRMALFDLGAGCAARLLLVVHHLAIDGVSWQILLEDLQSAYEQLSQGLAVKLPPKTTSYKHWADRLCDLASSIEPKLEVDYWMAERRGQVLRLPVDYSGGPNTVGSVGNISVWLDAEETVSLLQQTPQLYHARIEEILLTALAQAFARWTGTPSLLVDLERHGREELFEDVDLSRTVGWFTNIFPVLLDLTGGGDPAAALRAVKEQLRSIPDMGMGYGLSRYMNPDAGIIEKLRELPRAEVSFNYLGQLDETLPGGSPFKLARESSGPSRSLRNRRPYLIEINGGVIDHHLRFNWAYCRDIHKAATIESVAQDFIGSLRSLAAHSFTFGMGAHTSSDFPLAHLAHDALEKTFAEVEFEGE